MLWPTTHRLRQCMSTFLPSSRFLGRSLLSRELSECSKSKFCQSKVPFWQCSIAGNDLNKLNA